MYELLVDLVRAGHLLFFAAGFGAAIFLESIVLSRARRSIGTDELSLIAHGHRLVFLALGGLWLTGLALIWDLTGFQAAAFTPKLQMKIYIVGMLTANALVIAWVATPLIRQAQNGRLGDLEDWELALVGAVAGLSMAGWLSALGLGSVTIFKTMEAEALTAIFSGVLGAGAILGAMFGLHAGRTAPEAPLVPGFKRHDAPPRLAGFQNLNRGHDTTHVRPGPAGRLAERLGLRRRRA